MNTTPGPWQCDRSMRYRIVINSERANVATIPYLDREAQANAELIAAAPELLEALRLCLDDLRMTAHCTTRGMEAARAAIAKAEGRS